MWLKHNKMNTRVVPTFLLKGVDPHKLLQDYQQGFFNRDPPTKSPIKLVQNVALLANSYSSNRADRLYAIKDRNNSNVVLASSSYISWKMVAVGGEVKEAVIRRCCHCRSDVKVAPGEVPLGYPIAFEESCLLKDGHYYIIYTFWMEDTACDYECSLGYVEGRNAVPSNYRDPLLKDSARMLHYLYRLQYPKGEILRPAKDPLLLDSNGGSLTRAEWKDKSHCYLRQDRIVVLPARVEYVQQSSK